MEVERPIEKPVEKSAEYQIARLEMTIENMAQEISHLKSELAKNQTFEQKWKSLCTLNLKIAEAKETLYTVQSMLEVIGPKLNN